MIHVTLRLLTLGLPLALLYRRKSILPCAERPTIYLRKFDFGSTSRDLLVYSLLRLVNRKFSN